LPASAETSPLCGPPASFSIHNAKRFVMYLQNTSVSAFEKCLLGYWPCFNWVSFCCNFLDLYIFWILTLLSDG
jgi:hypothetical protein